MDPGRRSRGRRFFVPATEKHIMADTTHCHLCSREDQWQNLKAVDRLVRGEREFVFVHQHCFDNHERTMLREAYLASEDVQKKFSFQEWLEVNGAA
jgi:hypothetical protein